MVPEGLPAWSIVSSVRWPARARRSAGHSKRKREGVCHQDQDAAQQGGCDCSSYPFPHFSLS